jgi:hypothetical protein
MSLISKFFYTNGARGERANWLVVQFGKGFLTEFTPNLYQGSRLKIVFRGSERFLPEFILSLAEGVETL